MNIAIHQPNYMPWAGYFYKMAKSDVFVLLDSVQYEKNGMTNRVKIKTSQGPLWLTVPVWRNFPCIIKDAHIADSAQLKARHLKTIEMNYKRAPFFEYVFPELREILERDWINLSMMNIEIIRLFRQKLGITTRLEIASRYPDIKGKGDELLVNMCAFFGGDAYLSGTGGKKYQDENKFARARIHLEYSNFAHPSYHQLWGEFVPGLSVLDLLFNCGPQSEGILLGGYAS